MLTNLSRKCLAGLSLFLLISPMDVIAQSKVVQEYANPSNTITEHRKEKIHGTPFYNEDWEKGRVILVSGDKTKKMDLKYKIFTNELLFKKKGRTLAVKQDGLKGFSIVRDGQKVHFINGIKAPKYDISSQSLLQVIYKEKVKLLKRYTVKFHRGQHPDPYTGITNSRFQRYESYFLQDSKGNMSAVKLNKESLLKALPSNSSQVKSYAASNNLRFDDQQDVKKILAKYDKMLENTKQQ